MTFPALVFGSIIALILGSVFHLIVGGGLVRIIVSLVSSLIGFWVGHLVGYQTGWDFIDIGLIHLGPALIGSVLVLIVGYWLTLLQVEPD